MIAAVDHYASLSVGRNSLREAKTGYRFSPGGSGGQILRMGKRQRMSGTQFVQYLCAE